MAPYTHRLLLHATLGLGLLVACGRQGEPAPDARAGAATALASRATLAAGAAEVDAFHPDNQPRADGRRPPQPAPALGGSVTLHLTTLPARLNPALSSSADARALNLVLGESLLSSDPEHWTAIPALARTWTVEDQLVVDAAAAERLGARARGFERVLRDAQGAREAVRVVYGELTDLGERWRVTPRSRDNPLGAPLELDKREVREVVRRGVVTFELRDDARWHPSPGFEAHVFDADDVLFSFGIYANPAVNCDERRYQYQKVALAEKLDARGVRFFLGRPDAWAIDDVAEMPILPRHLFDLTDPDNADHDADATADELATYINDNRHNQEWIGLGPYRLTRYGEGVIEAERFEGYFDPARQGYLGQLRWRAIRDDSAALAGLLAGEIDVFARLKAQDYLGEQLKSAVFTDRLYRAWTQLGGFSYICWNMQRPQLADERVRRALAHCLDVDDLLATWWGGLGRRITGPTPHYSPGYDESIAPVAFDLPRARELLAEAGWYDRDGDGWVDQDGERLHIGFAAITGADFTRHVGLLLQENLKQVGVEFSMQDVEFSTFSERIRKRTYDAFSQSWYPPLEPDPEQLWHSRWGAPGVESANYPGLQDARVDALIERGQREPDEAARMALWRELHARLAEIAPFLWLASPATKLTLPLCVRGVQLFQLAPGYDLRRWYFPVGAPGCAPAGPVGYWAALAASPEPR